MYVNGTTTNNNI